jgi:hypothetical protein
MADRQEVTLAGRQAGIKAGRKVDRQIDRKKKAQT